MCTVGDGMKRDGDVWKPDQCTVCECKARHSWIYLSKICHFIEGILQSCSERDLDFRLIKYGVPLKKDAKKHQHKMVQKSSGISILIVPLMHCSFT